MSNITVPMPDEDLEFLRAYTNAQGTSAEAFLARQARNLREHLQSPLHLDVAGANGIIDSSVVAEETHRQHLDKKHT